MAEANPGARVGELLARAPAPRDVEDIYELTPLQQGILFHALYDEDPTLYVNQRSFVVDGPLQVDRLLAATAETVAAHAALRTSFHWEGLDKPLQVVHREVPLGATTLDWTGTQDYNEPLRRLLAEDLNAGFDPSRAPLQRLHLITLSDTRHVMVWTHHLLLLDGWSVPVFVREVFQRYFHAVLATPAPTPAPQYRDYVSWYQSRDLDEARRYWSTAFADGVGAPLAMLGPDGDAAPTLPRERVTTLSAETEARLRAAAARHSVTLTTLLQAAWSTVLQRHSGEGPVTFGVTSSCRPPELPQVERMMGLFTNTLPLRLDVPVSGPVSHWLQDIQHRAAALRRFEYSPLAQIKQWSGTPGGDPLFETLFIVDNYSTSFDVGGAAGLSFRMIDAVEKTSQPLVVVATPEPEFTLRIRFQDHRFAPGCIDALWDGYLAALLALAEADDVVEVTRVAAAVRPLDLGEGPRRAYADAARTLPELLERQAARTPSAPALLAEQGTLSYAELSAAARTVAARLAEAGHRPGSAVGICAERSIEMVVGILAALHAGSAYVPLDPRLPAARLAHMIRECDMGYVLARRDSAPAAHAAGAGVVLAVDGVLAAPDGAAAPPTPTPPGAPAYVMYTSGSTGRPKGVTVGHAAIVNRLLWMQETFDLTPSDRVLQKTPFGFDVSVWEIFWPLITGAAVVLARPSGHQDAAYLARTVRERGVTTMHFVPSMLGLFLDEPQAGHPTPLRQVFASGEALPPATAARFAERLPGVGLHNLYGPTEAAVDVTWWDCGRDRDPRLLPIGTAVANTRAVVVDQRLVPVPDGVPGELYLGGVQLADCYANRPDLTASTFVADPLSGPGARLYRTGDRVRRLPGGALDYLGRLDRQIKLHGYRIELGEIEHALVTHPDVREGAVVVRRQGEADRLIGYATPVAGADLDPAAVRRHLDDRLPSYMVPAVIVPLPAMPLTRNGKLDRAALPDPSPAHPDAAAPRPFPEGAALRAADAGPTGPDDTGAEAPEEARIAAVFADLLGLGRVAATANFFDLGGSSYDAVRAIRRIEGATVGLLGAHPTPRELAAALRGRSGPRLLARMSRTEAAEHTLVCVPFGGGSAVTYQPLAAVMPAAVDVLAVSPPGHELGGDGELRLLEEVAEAACEEIRSTTRGPVSVYGHCAGVGLAVEIVRRLEASGRPVDRLFLGGAYPFYRPGRVGRLVQRTLSALVARGLLRVSSLTVGTSEVGGAVADRAEMEYLRSIGGFEGSITEQELEFVMRAFRHDVATAADYFTRRWPPRVATDRLAAPVTVLLGTEDPLTLRPRRRYRAWARFGRELDLVTLAGAGHYFYQHNADAVAAAVAERLQGRDRTEAEGRCP